MELHIHKFEGAGNDFVLLDDRDRLFPAGPEAGELIRRLCDRRRGIGADGLMLLQKADVPAMDFRMRYFNADGGEAEMCGNGARCLARFAFQIGAAPQQMRFQTAAGTYTARIVGSNVAVAFPDIPELPRDLGLQALDRTWDATFLRAGVPHLAVWLEDLATAPVAEWGRALRFHPQFAPSGTNVNFAQPDPADPNTVRIRTYERGVEGETLACGTGAVASAICLAHRTRWTGVQDIAVIPTSGDRLGVSFDLAPNRITAVTLLGPAREVFQSTVDSQGLLHP